MSNSNEYDEYDEYEQYYNTLQFQRKLIEEIHILNETLSKIEKNIDIIKSCM